MGAPNQNEKYPSQVHQVIFISSKALLFFSRQITQAGANFNVLHLVLLPCF